MAKRYLFYIAQNYSFEILRPLQSAIQERGDEVKWFGTGKELNHSIFYKDEIQLNSIQEVINYNPDACFVPGNLIPSFIPGVKVQVFHGLEWKKKGHFTIRNCFDLYCTHGFATTNRFNELANQHGFFDVVETGWPKLDNLFSTQKKQYFSNDKPTILYAPTFSPSLTSAPTLFNEIEKLVNENSYNWLIKFHPKMNENWIEQYQKITSANFKVIDTSNINALLQSSDIMISDTSSVIGEFSLLNKAVVTLNNSVPGDYLINITSPSQLSSAIDEALSPSETLKKAINRYVSDLHPYKDGKSSLRILEAVDHLITNGKKNNKSLPINLFRTIKQRKRLGYWKL